MPYFKKILFFFVLLFCLFILFFLITFLNLILIVAKLKPFNVILEEKSSFVVKV